MKRILGVALILTLLAACGGLNEDPGPAAHPASGPEGPTATGPSGGSAPAGSTGTGGASGPPGASGSGLDRVGIYAAVASSVIEFRDETIWIWTSLCPNAGEPEEVRLTDCEELTADEQEALAASLENLKVRFVDDPQEISDRIFGGQAVGDELVKLGPIELVDGRIQVPGSHYCGGLCAGGSVWVVEHDGSTGAWTVTGTAPGAGIWIS